MPALGEKREYGEKTAFWMAYTGTGEALLAGDTPPF